MDEKNLNQKLKNLESKLEELDKKSKQPRLQRFIKKTSFIQGFVFSMLVTSAIAVAFTLPNTFTSSTVISSSQVNANFAAIETKLSELDVGFVSNMSTSQSVTCGNGTFGAFIALNFDTAPKNDGNYVTANGTYTFTTSGYYRVIFKVEYPSYGGMSSLQLNINGTSTPASFTTTINEDIRYFTSGDFVKLEIACDDKFGKGTPTMTVIPGTNIFAITPL